MIRRVLVTNDDGVDSVGIRTLARVAHRIGLDVVVAAPTWDASGSSAAITAVEVNGRLRFEQRDWAHDGIGAVFAVEASPAFIVRAAIAGAFGPPPDVVVSGINHGPNTGCGVLHSGTVGAALTAYNQGRPAMAISMVTGSATYWETAAGVGDVALRWLVDAEHPAILNVNVPNVAPQRLEGFDRARLAAVGAVQATITAAGQGSVKVAFHDGPAELSAQPGTDEAMLAAGSACFTALRSVYEDDRVSTEGLGGVPDGIGRLSGR